MKPKRLIITDKDTCYGLKQRYYSSDIQEDFESGETVAITIAEASKKYGIKNAALNSIYILNPYNFNSYLDINDADIEMNLTISRCIAYREACRAFGVYSASIIDNISHKIDESTKTEVKGGTDAYNGKVSHQNNKQSFVDIKAYIELHPGERKRLDIREIQACLEKYGIENDIEIKPLMDKLMSNQPLEGSEEISITFTNEYKRAYEFVSELNILKANIGFSLKKQKTEEHIFSKTLKICWNNPNK
ncbi:MAG: hypothetical protein IKH89_00585 [Bacteroidales bacterium]|nr:hypothetical protein [Bacteroidales bacterium]